MNILSMLLVAFLMGFSPSHSLAYKVDTHRGLSLSAAKGSVLATDSRVLSNLGLRLMEDGGQVFPNSHGTPRAIIELIQDGAEYEDATFDALHPPYAVSRHHFYDPVNQDGLGFPCFPPICESSPDWALEDFGEISSQEFSFSDARRYLEHALTDVDEVERNRQWGLVFEALGHVIHHLQDMAQPQHVRNEYHLGAARYEAYVKQPVPLDNNEAEPALPENLLDYPVVVPSNPNVARSLWQTRSSCDEADPATCWGSGIAEFTNYNFLTEDHNFRGYIDVDSEGQPLPPPFTHLFPASTFSRPNADGATADVLNWPDPFPPDFPDETTPLVGKVYLIRAPLRDAVHHEPGASAHVATYSLLDYDLETYNVGLPCALVGVDCHATFNLTHLNFEDARWELLRRARAYSTGLIDYFFRSLIDFRPDPTHPGQYLIKNLGSEFLVGKFRIFYDTPSGTRLPTQVLYDTGSEGLPPGGTLAVPFAIGVDVPSDATAYVLVFKGSAGAELGPSGSLIPGEVGEGERSGTITAKRKAISVPVLVNPAGRFRHTQAGWEFTHDAGEAHGQVNWFGVDGALSWVGDPARSLGWGLPGIMRMSPLVWEGGEAKYEAPGPVLGAALTTDDATGRRYLVVIAATSRPAIPGVDCPTGLIATGEQAYRAALDEAVLTWEPGPQLQYLDDDTCMWSRTTAYNLETGNIGIAPYFFNASGTEAVSLKGCPGCSPATQLVTFSWASGFTLGPLENPHHCPNPDYTVTMAADYQGDNLVTASFHQIISSEFSCAPASIPHEWITSGPFMFSRFNPSQGTYRGIWYLDLRTPSPTIVYYDQQIGNQGILAVRPGWVVGGSETLLGPWVPRADFASTDPTVAVDPQGNVILDWDSFHLSRLFPSADVKLLAGKRGPVGLM